MNLPINPREGDRRQKALRARVLAMSNNNATAKRLLNRFAAMGGQNRARVAAGMQGPRGSGVKIGAKPGGLNFLPIQPGGGMGKLGLGQDSFDSMIPQGMLPQAHHVANPLPSAPLGGSPSPPGVPYEGSTDPETGAYTSPYEQALGAGVLGQQPSQAVAPGNLNPNSPQGVPLANGLVPLGNGQFYDPVTGEIHGAHPGAGGGIGNLGQKAV